MSAPAAAPEVLAGEAQLTCGEKNPAEGVRCARPAGHAGGHLSDHGAVYWQAAK